MTTTTEKRYILVSRDARKARVLSQSWVKISGEEQTLKASVENVEELEKIIALRRGCGI